MSFVDLLSPLASPTPILTHHYLSLTLMVLWSISLFMLMTLSLQVTMIWCRAEVHPNSFLMILPYDSSLRILDPLLIFLVLK